jgi:hypothetical protein
MSSRIADAQATASAFLAGATWVADLTAWLQIGATVVAIFAGATAAWYHIERAIELRRQRRIRKEKGE